jgi:hypothetical protein
MNVWSKSLTLDGADTSHVTASDAVGHLSEVVGSSNSSARCESGTHVNGNQRLKAGAALSSLSDDVRET